MGLGALADRSARKLVIQGEGPTRPDSLPFWAGHGKVRSGHSRGSSKRECGLDARASLRADRPPWTTAPSHAPASIPGIQPPHKPPMAAWIGLIGSPGHGSAIITDRTGMMRAPAIAPTAAPRQTELSMRVLAKDSSLAPFVERLRGDHLAVAGLHRRNMLRIPQPEPADKGILVVTQPGTLRQRFHALRVPTP